MSLRRLQGPTYWDPIWHDAWRVEPPGKITVLKSQFNRSKPFSRIVVTDVGRWDHRSYNPAPYCYGFWNATHGGVKGQDIFDFSSITSSNKLFVDGHVEYSQNKKMFLIDWNSEYYY